MGQKKIFAVVRVLNGVGLIVRALHKDAFSQEKFRCIFLSSYLSYHQDITYHRGSPDRTNFVLPGNCTFAKKLLIEDWFSTKIAIYDFWIFKVPFFWWFSPGFSRNFDFWKQKNDCLVYIDMFFELSIIFFDFLKEI